MIVTDNFQHNMNKYGYGIFILPVISLLMSIGLTIILLRDVYTFFKLKHASQNDILNNYIEVICDFNVDNILSLNNLYINQDNLIKRLYEMLDLNSTNLTKIEFTNKDEFAYINDVCDDDQIKFIKKQAQHTKLSLKELQLILKDYVDIVEKNYSMKENEFVNQLKISNSNDIFNEIQHKKGDN